MGGPCELAETSRRVLINPCKGKGLKKGTLEGRFHLNRDTDGKKEMGYEEPASRPRTEKGLDGAPDRLHEAMAKTINLRNGYDKQQANLGRLERVQDQW